MLEAFYLSFGEQDWALLADRPDNDSATAFSLASRVAISFERQLRLLYASCKCAGSGRADPEKCQSSDQASSQQVNSQAGWSNLCGLK
jgi:hypothetical protein